MATDMTNFVDDEANPVGVASDAKEDDATPEADLKLVREIQKRIREDKTQHDDAFKRMREDMFLARHGHLKGQEKTYKTNLCGRHVKQKVAALFAKNPKATAKRRETMDFRVWDERPTSLMQAMQVIQQGRMLLEQAPPNPLTGQPDTNNVAPELLQAFQTAQEVVQDYQQGTERRQQLAKVGKTLEILFAHSMREQKPLDFKMGMKQLVRRTSTCGVGYVELGFQREYGPRPGFTERLADFQDRIAHLKRIAEEVAEEDSDIGPDDWEIAELQHATEALMAEAEVLIREGLVIDFPQATRVIPDKLCREIVGFVGARRVTLEYMYTPEQVEELFGVDLDNKYKSYGIDGTASEDEKASSPNYVKDDDDISDDETYSETGKASGLCCVWKHYDKEAGLVYYVCDGHKGFLRPPAAPDVFVEDFWPVYALTFNATEDEESPIPLSDVRNMRDMQLEYNRSRQGMNEHRNAARPRWSYSRGALQDSDIELLKKCEAFDAIGLDLPANAKLSDVMTQIQVPGVDPNLYQTEPYMQDVQFAVGSQEAQFGGVAKATATESAIAANASTSADGSSIDDLDGFLSTLSRAAGQILLREVSEETAMRLVGVGAVWPEMSLQDVAEEIYLDVEAGSTGKPNQAVQVQNFKELAPMLIQIPGISPEWLAREAIRRLDDKADLTEALTQDVPSIMAQNRLTQMSTGDPATDPNAQGGEGADNASAPADRGAGSGPAFGSNQV